MNIRDVARLADVSVPLRMPRIGFHLSSHVVGMLEQFGQAQDSQKRREIL